MYTGGSSIEFRSKDSLYIGKLCLDDNAGRYKVWIKKTFNPIQLFTVSSHWCRRRCVPKGGFEDSSPQSRASSTSQHSSKRRVSSPLWTDIRPWQLSTPNQQWHSKWPWSWCCWRNCRTRPFLTWTQDPMTSVAGASSRPTSRTSWSLLCCSSIPASQRWSWSWTSEQLMYLSVKRVSGLCSHARPLQKVGGYEI